MKRSESNSGGVLYSISDLNVIRIAWSIALWSKSRLAQGLINAHYFCFVDWVCTCTGVPKQKRFGCRRLLFTSVDTEVNTCPSIFTKSVLAKCLSLKPSIPMFAALKELVKRYNKAIRRQVCTIQHGMHNVHGNTAHPMESRNRLRIFCWRLPIIRCINLSWTPPMNVRPKLMPHSRIHVSGWISLVFVY